MVHVIAGVCEVLCYRPGVGKDAVPRPQGKHSREETGEVVHHRRGRLSGAKAETLAQICHVGRLAVANQMVKDFRHCCCVGIKKSRTEL